MFTENYCTHLKSWACVGVLVHALHSHPISTTKWHTPTPATTCHTNEVITGSPIITECTSMVQFESKESKEKGRGKGLKHW